MLGSIKLNIEKEYLENHQVKLTVAVSSDRFDNAKRSAARKLSKGVKIPGFRPGKAPYNVIVRHVGEATIIEEGLEILVNDIYPEIINESGINPYSSGTLESVEELDPPVLKFIVPLEAEVELGDYKAIQRDYQVDPISDQQIDIIIENIREQQAVIEPVDREAIPGDIVSVKIVGKNIGEQSKDEDAVVVKERVLSILIKESIDNASEWPYPGFSSNLSKHKNGEQIIVSHKYDEDTPYENLRNLEVEFLVDIESVRSRTLPDLDEEFLSAIGDYESIEKLREDILESVTQESTERYQEEYDEAILEELISTSNIKYPPQMVENQINSLINNLEVNLQEQNLDMDLYLKSRQMDLDGLRDELKPIAESRIIRTIVLMEIAKLENITIDPAELQEETLSVIKGMNSLSDSERIKITENNLENITGNVLASLIVNKAMNRFRDIANGQASIGEIQTDIQNSTEDVANLAYEDVELGKEADTESEDSEVQSTSDEILSDDVEIDTIDTEINE